MNFTCNELTLDCLKVAITRIDNEWEHPARKIHCDKIYLILDGSGYLRLGSLVYSLLPGQVYFIAEGTEQEGRRDCDGKLRILWIHARILAFNRRSYLNLFPEPRAIKGEPFKQFLKLGREMWKESKNVPSRAQSLLLQSYLLRMLALRSEISKTYVLRAESNTPVPRSTALPERIEQITGWLALHYAELLTLNDIAAQVGLHPTHFSRVFTKAYGMPPMKYLKFLRMEAARRMLVGTHLSVEEVGRRCGYPDPYYFSRTFRISHEKSPSKYRQDAKIL